MKRPPRPETSAGEAARLGEELREARLSLGLSIEDIATGTRIRRPYLVALEEGRVRDLPAPAYAVGFVRTYAKALGLDDNEMVRRFREASGPVVQRKTDLIFPEAVPERGVPAGAVILVGAVLAVGGYLGWYQWSGSGTRTVDAVPPLPARLEQVAATAPVAAPPAASLPTPAPDAPKPSLPTSSAAAPSASPPVQAPVQAPLQAPAQPPAAAAAPPRPGIPAPAAIPVAAPPASPARPAQPAAAVPSAPAPATAAPPGEGRILLRAKAETWVQVRDTRAGSTLMNRVLKPGETYAVPAREGLLLSTGNAGGLDIVVDGQVAPGLGAAQAVRRDVPLEPDRLRAGVPVPAAIPVSTAVSVSVTTSTPAQPATPPRAAPQ